MKSLKIIAVSIAVLPVLAFAQTTTPSAAPVATTSAAAVLPAPGLTPDSPFYFLNRVSEALQEFFTFSPDAKARLELSFAAERIAEIKAMIAAKGAATPGIDTAKTILNENLAKASAAVASEKQSGADVTGLAKEVSNTITSQKLALRNVYGQENKNLSEQEKSVKEQIKVADNAGDTAKASALVQDLSALSNERAALKLHDDESSQEFDNEDNNVDSALVLKDQAQNAIDDAKKSRAELLAQDPTLTDADFALVDKAITSAEDLFAKENFQAAKELAHQAEKAIERVKNEAEKSLEQDSKTTELIKKYEDQRGATTSQSGELNRESAKKQAEMSLEAQKKAAEQNIKKLNAGEDGQESGSDN